MGFRSHPVVLANSKGNLNILQKLLIFHDQGIFSLLFVGSLLLHVILVIMVGILSEFLKPEPPPIRAKIGVRYAELPAKPTPVINAKTEIQKPVLQKLEAKPLEKLIAPEPKQPVLKKPILQDTIKNSVLSKPALPQPEAPRLKMPQPNKIPLLSEGKKPDFKKTSKFVDIARRAYAPPNEVIAGLLEKGGIPQDGRFQLNHTWKDSYGYLV